MTIPACEPVSEIALWPRSLIAIAHSAQEIALAGREEHVHLARIGLEETSSAIAISSSVVLPRADRTATTRLPGLALGDDAPGCALDPLGVGDGGAAELHDHGRVGHPRRG